jgi:prevent-host-death family protein
MRTATIREAKDKLEELIAAARAGEEVEITENGRRVASLTSGAEVETTAERIHVRHDDSATERLIARMVAEGLMVRNPLPPDPAAVDYSLPNGDSGALQALLDEREEGR